MAAERRGWKTWVAVVLAVLLGLPAACCAGVKGWWWWVTRPAPPEDVPVYAMRFERWLHVAEDSCPNQMAFHPDGTLLVAGSRYVQREPINTRGVLRFWRPETGVEARPALEFSGDATAVDVTRDGRTFAVAAGGTVTVSPWQGEARRELSWPGELSLQRVALSRDGALVAAAAGLKLRVWRAADGHVAWETELPEETRYLAALIVDLAFSPDGSLLAVAEARGIRLYAAPDGALRRTLRVPREPSPGIAFSPDGAQIVALSAHWGLQRWSVPDGRLLFDSGYVGDHDDLGEADLFWTANGLLLGVGRRSAVEVRRAADGTLLGVAPRPADDPVTAREPSGWPAGRFRDVTAFAASSDGAWAATFRTGDTERGVRLWRLH